MLVLTAAHERRMPSFRFRSLLLLVALTALAFAGTAASASAAPFDFAFSATPSVTAASAHPNLSLAFSTTSMQPLKSLQVDLPVGMAQNPQGATECTKAAWQGDSCTATSIVGAASVQLLVVGLLPVTGSGTIYRVSDPTSSADATYGIILRPPNSARGVVAKVFLTDAVTFRPDSGLRHSITGLTGALTIAGNQIPARVTSLVLQLAGKSSTGGLLISNPTSCRVATTAATALGVSAATGAVSSSFTTTDCKSVPFTPTASITLDNPAVGVSSGFSINIGQVLGDEAIHKSHVKSLDLDSARIGNIDLGPIKALPACSAAQLSSSTCPAASKIGGGSVVIEGFGSRPATLFKSGAAPQFAVFEIALNSKAKFWVPVKAVTSDGVSSVSIGGLPELPLSQIDLFHAWPAIAIKPNLYCGETSHFRVAGHFGAVADFDQAFDLKGCTMQAPVITAGPDRGITINTTHVEYRFGSPQTGVTFECRLDQSAWKACRDSYGVDGLADGVHTFGVRAVRGSNQSAVTTATFEVDAVPAAIQLLDSGDNDSDGDGFADNRFRPATFSVPFTATDPGNGIDISRLACDLNGMDGSPRAQGHVVAVSGNSSSYACQFDSAPRGDGVVTLTAKHRYVGTVTIVKLVVTVDPDPPTLAFAGPADLDTDGDGFADQRLRPANFDVFFTAADASFDIPQGRSQMRRACYAISKATPWKHHDVQGLDAPQQGVNGGVCNFVGLEDGDWTITVEVTDAAGNTSSRSVDVTVDNAPASIVIDQSGVHYSNTPAFKIGFVATDDQLLAPDDALEVSCQATDVRNGGTVKGNISIINGSMLRVAGDCQLDTPGDGEYEVTLQVKHKYVGTVTIVKLVVVVQDTPPV